MSKLAKRRILLVFGTRPEAIKMAPLYHELRRVKEWEVKTCITGQHREMIDQVLKFFEIVPDYDLNLMKANQTLFDVTSRGLEGLKEVLQTWLPDLILVQGDTTTAFIGALAGFYVKCKVGHLEAGLRSHNKFSPYPEEMNRVLASRLADFHFAPTKLSRDNLRREGLRKNVWAVGNTVIDALFLGLKVLRKNKQNIAQDFFPKVNFRKKIILVTAHRRESFGSPFVEICQALRQIAENFQEEVELVYPVHLNPNVQEVSRRILSGVENIHLLPPLAYPQLLWILHKSHLVLTDSGGIQEEAPSLGKPVLVLRDVTERTESIKAGTAILVGTNRARIVRETGRLLTQDKHYQKMADAHNPYGDGTTSVQIRRVLKNLAW